MAPTAAQTVLLVAVCVLLITELILASRDFYHVLGVPRDATDRQIKKAFHKLAMKCHPDKNKSPDAEAKFREIAEAYETLSDDRRRREYDRLGGQHHGPLPGQGGGGRGGDGANFHQYFQSFNFDDLFKGFDQFGQPHHNHNHNHNHHHHHHRHHHQQHHQHHQHHHANPHSHAYAHAHAYAHSQNSQQKRDFDGHFQTHEEAINAHKRQFQQDAFGGGGGGGGGGGVFDNVFEDLEKMFSFDAHGSRGEGGFPGAAGKHHCRTVTQRRGNMVSTFTDCSS